MTAIVLLSGGLDSVVSMLKATEENEIILALTFDYGQRSKDNEIRAARNICQRLGVKHKVIELPFMQDMPVELSIDSTLPITSPWVPNRNSLFINIGATYAEFLQANLIICGFNQEEAVSFPDNSKEFIQAINNVLSYSTQNQVKVKSYVDNLNKEQIIKEGVRLGLDFRYIWSCYQGTTNPCGECSSCVRNMEAFAKAGVKYSEKFVY